MQKEDKRCTGNDWDNWNGSSNYEDIIELPHHQSTVRPHMSLYDRAAQFSPFAALTGYEDAVKETGRLTETRVELSEEKQAEIQRFLSWIYEHLHEQPEIKVVYFVPDEKKTGGAYRTEQGTVKKMDEYNKMLILDGQREIPVNEIVEIWKKVS